MPRAALSSTLAAIGLIASIGSTVAAAPAPIEPDWPGPFAVTSSAFRFGASASIPAESGQAVADMGGIVALALGLEEGRPLPGWGLGIEASYRWLTLDSSVEGRVGVSGALSYRAITKGAWSISPSLGVGGTFDFADESLRPSLALNAALSAKARIIRRDYVEASLAVHWIPSAEHPISFSASIGPRSERAWIVKVPEPYVALRGVPKLFSPDGDRIDDRFDIRLFASPPAYLASWSIAVIDPDGTTFYSREGQNPCPATFSWDGRSNAGRLVDPATDYRLCMETVDILGRRAVAEAEFTVDILVERVGDKYRVRVPPILFPSDSADLGGGAAAWMVEANAKVLSRLVALFSRFPDYKIIVEGHANSVRWADPAAFAKEQEGELKPLSLARAAAVMAALIQLGVAPDRIGAEGLGAAEPLIPFSDASGAWRNRRVEIRLEKPARR